MNTNDFRNLTITIEVIEYPNHLRNRRQFYVHCNTPQGVKAMFRMNVDCPYKIGDKIYIKSVKKVEQLIAGQLYLLKGLNPCFIYRDGKRIY